MPGKPGIDATSSEAADAAADDLIRMVMADQARGTGAAAEATTEGAAKPIRHPRRLFRKSAPASATGTAKPGRTVRDKMIGPMGAALARVGGYRPTRKHVFFAVLAVIFLVRPWLIPVTLFIAFWACLIAYLTLGPDRVAELVVGGWRWLHVRRPELAETIRQRAEAMAIRIDAFLDRMPANWTEGLYVPDFSTPDAGADERPDPFDRLAKESPRG